MAEAKQSSMEVAKIAYNALDDKKGIDIKVLDISGVSVMADNFVIASGGSVSQVQALCNSVEEKLKEQGIVPKQIEGYNGANWILMDYGDTIIHIFDKENRSFYDLERIWKDGNIISMS